MEKNEHNIKHVVTKDGSSTLFAPRFDEHYHSTHGAIQESLHVFIQSGLYAHEIIEGPISILEMGFGTGLNALLTCLYKGKKHISYTSLEAYPVPDELIQQLNYATETREHGAEGVFETIHAAPWEVSTEIVIDFHLLKHQIELQAYQPGQAFDVIYFDAFAPNAQPELWTKEIFSKLYNNLNPGGVFVTYSAKGNVRRALLAAGFEVEKIPGPPGKREMLRGRKK